jgi:hypothetical protein
MKNLLFIFFISLVCCSSIEVVPPINCYVVEVLVSTMSGKVLKTTTQTDFVWDLEAIEKWKDDEGITISRDTIKHTMTIKMVKCVEIDSKNEK